MQFIVDIPPKDVHLVVETLIPFVQELKLLIAVLAVLVLARSVSKIFGGRDREGKHDDDSLW